MLWWSGLGGCLLWQASKGSPSAYRAWWLSPGPAPHGSNFLGHKKFSPDRSGPTQPGDPDHGGARRLGARCLAVPAIVPATNSSPARSSYEQLREKAKPPGK